VGSDVHVLDRPAFAVRQVLDAQARKNVRQERRGLGVRAVLDLRPHERRIEHRVVIEQRRDIDDAAGQFHRSFLGASA
jgi:hypothetical protein